MIFNFIGVILLVFLSVIQGRVGRIGALRMIIWNLPSTVLHECSHYFVALATGGCPTGFTILPRSGLVRYSDGSTQKQWVLGSVQSTPTLLSAAPTALAPLLFVPLSYYVFSHWGGWVSPTPAHAIAEYAALFVLLTASVPSKTDVKVAFGHPLSLLLYCAIGVGIAVYWPSLLALSLQIVHFVF